MKKGETGRQAMTVYLDMEAFEYQLERNELTMADLSRKMGHLPTYIKGVIRLGYLKRGTLEPIAKALGVETDALIFGHETLSRVSNGPMCYQRGKCFARSESGRCSLLTEPYNGRKCPFQKERRV